MVPVGLAQRRWIVGEGEANVTMVSTAHVWIVGFSILLDGRSMDGGAQHQWIEERREEKGTALMASNAHAVFVVSSTPPAAVEI